MIHLNKNIIFYFSGTGNSLQGAREIAKTLENCQVVSMTDDFVLADNYTSIGFIYPIYFQGMPLCVRDFVLKINWEHNKKAYVYAVATYGAIAGNGLSQMKKLLSDNGVKLNYGEKIVMFSNYVVRYDMSKKVKEKTAKFLKNFAPIVENIKNKKTNEVSNPNFLLEKYYNAQMKAVASLDRNFNISDDCISCGICEKVCQGKNIVIKEGKPFFQNKCQQCVACIQVCPRRAIDYKNSTKKRGRYINPTITYEDLIVKK